MGMLPDPMPVARPEPDEGNRFQGDHVRLLLRSYRLLTGQDLIQGPWDSVETARRVYHSAFVLLSHDSAADPLFTYANLKAQELFDTPWSQFVTLPSRYSAEPLLREARQTLLERVSRQGYIDDYQGVRISGTGRRFRVRNATVWNLLDEDGRVCGQAATFGQWQYL